MKRLIVSFVLVSSLWIAAQETRRQAIHPAKDPSQETKSNSDLVPDVYALRGSLERIVVLRFKYNADLLAGLEKAVSQEKIRNAVILSAIGSVRNYQVHQIGNREFPVKDVFVKNPTLPADILGMSGFVMGGRVHLHITLASPDKAFGGHLEPDTTVFTFAIVTLGVLPDDLDLSRIDDWSYR
jgi:predicted DNA-binding protein with PD1-like motif